MKLIGKGLEREGCKVFVCPNISLIYEFCKRLNLTDAVAECAKEMAIDYFKKTYHSPKYSSAKPVIIACIYIASITKNEPKNQLELGEICGCSYFSIRKWYRAVADELDIEIIRD